MSRSSKAGSSRLRARSLGLSGDVVVGCSGGADSSALAHWAAGESRAGRLGRVTLVYVDHQLRPESADDGVRVTELAERLGVAAHSVTVTVGSGASLERAAREARHRALAGAADRLGARWILLGHTASDQAETVLHRILRGTGLTGLAGIPPLRGRIARPLLDVTRAEVEAYCRAHGLRAVEDATNRDLRFTRNRIRYRWLPQLRGENPRLDRALCRLAEAAREVREAVDTEARAIAAEREPDGAIDVSAALGAAPAAVAKRALALLADEAGLGPLGREQLEELYRLSRAPRGGTVGVDLPGGRAERVYDCLTFVHSGAGPAPAESGEIEVRGAQGPYRVRTWQPGDRMRPARLLGHSRKLSDLYSDARVPRAARRRARVVVRESDGAIVWAEHVGPAHGAQIAVRLDVTGRRDYK